MTTWMGVILESTLSSLRWVSLVLCAFGVCSMVRSWAAPGLSWVDKGGYRYRDLQWKTQGKTGFTRLDSKQTGLVFTNLLDEVRAANNRILENGSGVALGDVDGDGWCDVFLPALEGSSRLFRNLGDFKFADITLTAGVGCEGQSSTGAAFVDVDGDSDMDLLVNSIGGGTRCFTNDGTGRFSEVLGSRLVRRFGSTSMALSDFDGDGDLDLYVTNYRTDTYKDNAPGSKPEARMVDGQVQVTPADRFVPVMAKAGGVEVIERGERDFLYLNDGKGRFLPVSWTGGAFLDEHGAALTGPPLDWGLSVMFRDLNQDRHPDIFVCNDFFYFPDRIWISEDSRRFRAAPVHAFREVSMSSMAVDVADINRDGFDDIFVVDMLSRDSTFRHRQKANMMNGELNLPFEDPGFRPEVPRNTLFLNRGNGTYAEVAQMAGLEATEWSWGVMFLDVDLDGYEDVLVVTGNWHDVLDADTLKDLSRLRQIPSAENRLNNLRRFPLLPRKKLAFLNNRDVTFQEVGETWGFADEGVATGMAGADLDRDGDIDLVVNHLNGESAIYRNETPRSRVLISLRGAGMNTAGIGGRISLLAEGLIQSQEIISGGRYLSSDEPVRCFAIPKGKGTLEIEVRWRTGRTSRVSGVEPGRHYEIVEDGNGPIETPSTVIKSGASRSGAWFEDVSSRLGHKHEEVPYSDFDRQGLLSRRMSRLGPGLAWTDVDGDGIDDLVIGAGKTGQMGVWKNAGDGQFTRLSWTRSMGEVVDDTTSLLGIMVGGGFRMVVGSASYEGDPRATNAVLLIDPHAQTKSTIPQTPGISTGAIASADIDADGDLDLFVGHRMVVGRYPEASGARLFVQQDGRLVEDLTSPVRNVGMVSGAVFTDLNTDGYAELVVVGEWSFPRVFENEKGRFKEASDRYGVQGLKGWWNGVSAGDFNNDGLMDLVLSNWGRNSRFQLSLQSNPIRIWHGDFDGNSTWDLIEGTFDSGLNRYVPWRSYDAMVRSIPAIGVRAPTFRAYGRMGVSEMLGSSFEKAQSLEATTLDSMVLLNSGQGRLDPIPLCKEAQMAPAMAVSVGDCDGDGNEDLFLSQNFFGVEYETSRYAGGIGLCMVGTGDGRFTATPLSMSGIMVMGEQRGGAVSDFDRDGRLDWVVSQNSGETKLYRNVKSSTGLRLLLNAGTGNPTGVGARVRWTSTTGRRGPMKEVHAGSGYWSQDSAVIVIHATSGEEIQSLEVIWPGGEVSRVLVPQRAKELSVKRPGT